METVETPSYQQPPEYAGFWLRLAAHIIDHFALGLALGSIVAFSMLAMGISAGLLADMDHPANQVIVISLSAILGVLGLAASWLYYALLESSSHQGTLGKMALNMKITDMSGNRITFARATGRFFGKFLSSFILYIGYIMIGFTEKRQGLHDILAGCLVIKK